MNKKQRINSAIRVKEVMVIDADGTQLGVLNIEDALEIAKNKNLDLVEVSPNATPPVCKILDFGKFKYKKSKKDHESKRKQKVIKTKEVKMTPTIGEHDYNFKLSHIKKFLKDGDKVKVTVVFRGRMIDHKDFGFTLLKKVTEETKDEALVETQPRSEGQNMILMLAAKV